MHSWILPITVFALNDRIKQSDRWVAIFMKRKHLVFKAGTKQDIYRGILIANLESFTKLRLILLKLLR